MVKPPVRKKTRARDKERSRQTQAKKEERGESPDDIATASGEFRGRKTVEDVSAITFKKPNGRGALEGGGF